MSEAPVLVRIHAGLRTEGHHSTWLLTASFKSTRCVSAVDRNLYFTSEDKWSTYWSCKHSDYRSQTYAGLAKLAASKAPVLLKSPYDDDAALVTEDTRYTFPHHALPHTSPTRRSRRICGKPVWPRQARNQMHEISGSRPRGPAPGSLSCRVDKRYDIHL